MELTKNQVELLKVTKQIVGKLAAISSFTADLQGYVLYSDWEPTEKDIEDLKKYRGELYDLLFYFDRKNLKALGFSEDSQKR